MAEQMAFFAQAGWPTDAPLRCGIVWLIENAHLIRRCWDVWWDQNLRFGMMDQLSLTMMLRKHAIEPRSFDFSLVDNAHFTWGTQAKLCRICGGAYRGSATARLSPWRLLPAETAQLVRRVTIESGLVRSKVIVDDARLAK